MVERILVVVAHSDDQMIGPGGTLRKYALEGKEVHTVIFSFGELSHPHFKKEVIQQVRVEESEKADRFIGGKGVTFLGLKEGKFQEEFKPKELEEILLKLKPKKIFTHAEDENHPDHVVVNKLLLELYDKLHVQKKLTSDIYSFDIWRIFQTKKRINPKMVVDISETFFDKLKAIEYFKSQRVALVMLKWSVYLKAFVAGFLHNTRFGEVFDKIR
ncbi:MAG: PIG-L family deacetylase [Simkania sp.]|nr:PIG-L family deacetylase [Nanoarchaeota archaeon]MCB1084391.1 PIG-L family deacetylase [Simkania sp.]